MGNKNKNPTRKHGRHLRVPVLPNEESTIKLKAAEAGLSVASYLRRLGLDHTLSSAVNKDSILELSKINADLGRLGGLLKLWLTNDERVSHFTNKTINTLLARIADTQGEMLDKVRKL